MPPPVTPRTPPTLAVPLPAGGVPDGQPPTVQPARPRLYQADVVAQDFLNCEARAQDLGDLPQPRVPSLTERCDDYSCIPWRQYDPPPATRYLVYWLPAAAAGAVVTYGAVEGREDVAALGALAGVAWLALSTTFGLLCWR